MEPTSNGIGGDAFALIWFRGQLYGLNASGPAPMGISSEAVKKQGHTEMPRFGWLPVTVPGAPAAWATCAGAFRATSFDGSTGTGDPLCGGGFSPDTGAGQALETGSGIVPPARRGSVRSLV